MKLVGKIIGASIFGVLTIALSIGSGIAKQYEPQINLVLKVQTQKIIPDPDAKIYYWTDYTDEEELVKHEKELCEQIEGEGATLLLNKDNTLPLSKSSKFSCFSHSSVDLLYGGTGSGQVSSADAVSLKAALEDPTCFGEKSVNQELWTSYVKGQKYKRVNAKTTGGSQDEYRLNEMPWSVISNSAKEAFKEYGDVALVVLARSGGEGADLPSSNTKLTEYLTDGDYLRLCKEEEEIFQNIKELKAAGTFKKIVVLLNSSNALQIDFVDKYDVDALLWIGDVGMTGINAVADILCGNIVPSGRIVDTFLKDNHSAPAMANFGSFDYTNQKDYNCGTAQSNLDAGIGKCNQNYVVYQEGIYVGYRYYETRYEDYVLNQGNAGDFKYDDLVAYPFGYGLSYTEFAYSNFKVNEDGNNFKVNVTVKNTGSVDAKHTVQIYAQSPYTQYDKDNGIEKAAVNICGFDKKLIKAGQSENYEITVEKKDLISYDPNLAKTYILEDGDYYFTVGRNAHDATNNILAAKKADGLSVTDSRMSEAGDASLTSKWHNGTFDKTTYSKSSVTNKEITNLFDNADLNKYEGTADQKITYLSRNNWSGTFPTSTVSLKINETMWADGLTHEDSGRAAIIEKMIQKYYPDIASTPTTEAKNGLSVADLIDVDINDAKWQQLVEQCSYSEMIKVISNGFHQTAPVASINLPGTLDENGPQGFTKGLIGGSSAMCYTSEDVMAATYNLDLLNEMGKCIGEDFFHATKNDADTFYTGLYGPGANIHRTPYSGRNFEYYSEDGFVSGKMAASEVKGIQSKGVYVFTKHFALNDQEEGRYGISTWSNEQAIREIYLKGFEGSIVEGGGLGVMSSFNRLGVVWSGAHHGLMTGILRDEWGMKGAAITDCSVSATYMHNVMGVLAGQDLWDGNGTALLAPYSNNPAVVHACQQATKHIAYSIAHSRAMNIGNATIKIVQPWYMIVIYSLIGVCGAGTLAFGVLIVLHFIKRKKVQQ
jgi:beta-glucosidase